MPDCRRCGYRILLAKIADINVWGEDCDHYGTDVCRKMNEHIVIGLPNEIDFDYEAEESDE